VRSSLGLGLVVSLVLGSAPLGRASDGDRPPLRVLFIGNSYTRFNDLPGMVESLGASAPEGPRVDTRHETRGGFDLSNHWRRRRVRARIAHGGFDAVVLQGHSLVTLRAPGRLAEYARRFSSRVRAAGARLVLFQTWPRHAQSRHYRRLAVDGPSAMFERIDAVYGEVGRELGAPVAPVGRAWLQAHREHPELVLHRRDPGTHPSVAGTYLSACVLYGTLTGVDPRAARWKPDGLSEPQAERIRAIASESLAAP
jgi:hypothetical protein